MLKYLWVIYDYEISGMQTCLTMFQQNKIKIRVSGTENRQKLGRSLIITERGSIYTGFITLFSLLWDMFSTSIIKRNVCGFVSVCVCVHLFPTQ